jgi:hypothetical protein
MAPGQTDFAKKLCEQQREQAKAIQNAFLAENRAGEFEAFTVGPPVPTSQTPCSTLERVSPGSSMMAARTLETS